ncbi:MAG: YkgJ family cysteine cluster protein [Deltaproteobacteria bacterium]|nr:YkgJ family cysteine cluster protein [Deltaproteobacteria bacterium]
MKHLKEKQDLLFYIYGVFDAYVEATTRMACQRGCSLCCTSNVTLTTLEARLALAELRKKELLLLLDRPAPSERDYFRPEYTINDLALACFNGREPPEEDMDAGKGVCPLLDNEQCLVYEARPFACRSFFSLEKCRPGEEAVVPPSLIAVITACQQIIEHLDTGGFFGNLTDLLLWLREEEKREGRHLGSGPDSYEFPFNKTLPGLVIQPEEANGVQPFLSRLSNGIVNGEPFHVKLNTLHPLPPKGD